MRPKHGISFDLISYVHSFMGISWTLIISCSKLAWWHSLHERSTGFTEWGEFAVENYQNIYAWYDVIWYMSKTVLKVHSDWQLKLPIYPLLFTSEKLAPKYIVIIVEINKLKSSFCAILCNCFSVQLFAERLLQKRKKCGQQFWNLR